MRKSIVGRPPAWPRWAAAGLFACTTLAAGAVHAGGVRVIRTPPLLANPGWCSVSNVSKKPAEVTIRIRNALGVVPSPLGSPLERTVVLDPGHSEAQEGFAELEAAVLLRCEVEVPARAYRRIEVSFCSHPPAEDFGQPGATGCVQPR